MDEGSDARIDAWIPRQIVVLRPRAARIHAIGNHAVSRAGSELR